MVSPIFVLDHDLRVDRTPPRTVPRSRSAVGTEMDGSPRDALPARDGRRAAVGTKQADQRVRADSVSPGTQAGPGRLWERPRDLSTAVREARDGDGEAFRVLYTDIQPRLLRYLWALVGADAEDVASETWLHVARDLRSFHGDSDGFRGWVATIARHRATDHLRSLRRRPQAAAVRAEDLDMWVARDNTEDHALETVSTDEAIALISTLPTDQAEAVLLRVVVGLDAKQAARVLGKRPGAVRTASYRGLRRLAASLTETDEGPTDGPAAGEGRGQA